MKSVMVNASFVTHMFDHARWSEFVTSVTMALTLVAVSFAAEKASPMRIIAKSAHNKRKM